VDGRPSAAPGDWNLSIFIMERMLSDGLQVDGADEVHAMSLAKTEIAALLRDVSAPGGGRARL
jgi:hypothetical protein